VRVVKKELFSFRVLREVTRLETVDMQISAESVEAATEAALAFSSGEEPSWPSIQRYSLVDIQPLDAEVVSIDEVD